MAQRWRHRWLLLPLALVAAGCTGSPATPTPGPTRDHAAIVADLLGRPPRTPTLNPDGSCPAGLRYGAMSTPLNPATGGLDIAIGSLSPDPDGLYDLKVGWSADPNYQGPIVVRVGSLDGRNRGAVRLYYERSASRGDAVIFTLTGTAKTWPAGTFVSGPGCYVYQLDGQDFEQEITFGIVP
jgi:hypothetical protein